MAMTTPGPQLPPFKILPSIIPAASPTPIAGPPAAQGDGPVSASNSDSYRTSAGIRLAPQAGDVTQDSASIISRTTSSSMKRPLRPQYARDSAQRHVEFILVASFDIDRGSVMEHQYPSAISGDEHMLAELMLPDQAHVRAQDWTMFFLHKDPQSEIEAVTDASEKRRPKRRSRPHDPTAKTQPSEGVGEEDFVDGSDGECSSDNDKDDKMLQKLEGPPLIYVLNLVNTKQDSSLKRGAIVKAMAICTRHSFLHIYKPLLLLALEEYFRAPVPETLESLYNAVNAMDLSLLPRISLLERIILQSSNAKDLFMEKFQRMVEERKAEEAASSSKSIEAVPETPQARAQRLSLPRDTHEFESRIQYNGMSIPVKIPSARSAETVGDFSIIQLIQTFSTPHLTSPMPFTLHPHLTTGGALTHPIIVLVNAVLTQKRIMFLGHNRPSGEVAEAVLAACALASGGTLRGFTRHAFPYTDLTKIDDLLQVPGFIAGVTNPAFAHKPEWWDLLCDLPTGRMKISSKLETPGPTEGIKVFQQQSPAIMSQSTSGQSGQTQDFTGDVAFMDAVLRNISNRLGESVVRSMWRDWVVKFVRIAAVFEEAVYGVSAVYIGAQEADRGAFGVSGHGYVWTDEASKQKELAGNAHRIEGWRGTRSYYALINDLSYLYETRPISSIDLNHHHDRLRTQRLSKDEAAAIYLAFAEAVHSKAEINQLLTVTSESHGGLFYLALGLLHPQKTVRWQVAKLLERISRHGAGKHFWESLSRFSKLAYFRIREESEAAGGVLDDETANGASAELSRIGKEAA